MTRRVLLLLLLLACNPVEEPVVGPAVATACTMSGTRVAVSPAALAIVESGTGGLSAVVTTGCQRVTIDTGTVTWASLDPTIATVAGSNRSATVTGVAAGTVLITATFGSVLDTSSITVTAADTVACTSSSTHFCPGDDLNTKVQAAATGASFTFGPGTYSLQSITPKTGQTFTGGTGVILDGGRTLTGWTASGGVWYVGGQTQAPVLSSSGGCVTGYPMCHLANQLWRDGVLQTPVAGTAYLTSGTWYFDAANDRIYVGSDPTGHTIITSVAGTAFSSTARGVTITGVTIQHYAPDFNRGVIEAGGTAWLIASDTIRNSGNKCIRVEADSVTVRDSWVDNCGQLGLSASFGSVTGKGFSVLRTRMDTSCTQRINRGFSCGAMKVTQSVGMVFTGNRAEGNFGNGFWWDIDNQNAVATSDTARNNAGTGIFYEISYGCTITGGLYTGNGTDPSDALSNGAGILISASPDCEVATNTVSGNAHGILLQQQDRGSGAYGPHLVSNANIHDNTVSMDAGKTGFVGTFDQSAFNFSRNNLFTDNDYSLPIGATKFFSSNGSTVTDAAWQALPQDAGGTITRR